MITITYDYFENCIYIQIITITDYTYPSSDGYIPNMLWSDDFSWSYGPLVIWCKDFPRSNLGLNIGLIPIKKKTRKNFPNWCVTVPNLWLYV